MRRKITRSKTTIRRKPKKKDSFFSGKLFRFSILMGMILLIFGMGYHYRNGLAYYFSFKSYNTDEKAAKAKRISDVRNYQVLENHKGKAIGLDVSEFQETIDWNSVGTIENNYPIEFIFIRATAGNDRVDGKFNDNWLGAKKRKIIRGAYHYYRPNENSLERAGLYIKTVQFQKGDLPPVLDIEKLPQGQSLDSLRVGLKRWLKVVEAHYKVKPIIYTSEKYYDDFLKKDFSGYLFGLPIIIFTGRK